MSRTGNFVGRNGWSAVRLGELVWTGSLEQWGQKTEMWLGEAWGVQEEMEESEAV